MPNRLKSALAAHQAHSARLTAEAKAKKRDREIAQAKQSSGAKSKKQKKDKDKRHRVEGVITPGASTSHLTGSSTTGIDDGVKTRGPTLVNNDPPRQRPTIPFDKSDTILLLGEANFSYAHSLILPPHSHPPHLLLATSYDSEKMCYEKYPDAEGLVRILRETGVRVGWVVDSGDLERCKMVAKGRRWSRVIFNFPHVGAGIKDQDRNILANQHLILRTFRSVHSILTRGPEISSQDIKSKKRKRSSTSQSRTKSKFHRDSDDGDDNDHDNDLGNDDSDDPFDVYPSYLPQTQTLTPPNRPGTLLFTLLDQPPYTLWHLPKLGTKPPPLCPGPDRLPQPSYTLIRSFEFEPAAYEGYTHRRTIGFKDGLSKSGNEEIVGRKGKARTWEFAPVM